MAWVNTKAQPGLRAVLDVLPTSVLTLTGALPAEGIKQEIRVQSLRCLGTLQAQQWSTDGQTQHVIAIGRAS